MRLLTGFPGFLGTEFITRLLQQTDASFLVLVQEKFEELAKAQIALLEAGIPGATGRVRPVIGDITLPGLGLPAGFSLQGITEVDHFAAIYDLNVKESLARLVNIEGTRNVLDFARGLPDLRALHYVSTCYVSGRFGGTFLESDLEKGQVFNNFYESTKFEAERLVRARMKDGLPAVIYRPSIVVGDSRTGATRKYDGPYFVIQWLLRQGKSALLPRLGDPSKFTINLVPSNYVLDAMVRLSQQPSSIGQTFQLADPRPYTIGKIVDILARDCERSLIQIPLPKNFAKFAVSAVPGLEGWLGIPRGALDYFVHPTRYDTSETLRSLQGTGIECPDFSSYSKTLVEYMKENPGVRSKPLV
jgi:thioester reductase-like protein